MRIVGTGLAVVVALAGLGAGCATSGGGDDACAGATVTVRGTDAGEHLRGTSADDVIWAGAGNDVVDGLGGDDLICGGPGADQLDGGEGDDVVDGGADERVTVDTDSYEWNGDVLSGGPGDDTMIAGPGARSRSGATAAHPAVDEVTFSSAAAPVVVDLERGRATGEGRDRLRGPVGTVVGSPGDDTLRGSDRGEGLLGGPGSDLLDGRGGDDRLDAAGSPRLDAAGNEPVESTRNTLVGGPGDDELSGSRGDDDLDGGPGSDALHADLGADRALGGEGEDTVDDYVVTTSTAGARRQLLDGGAGRDRLGSPLLARPTTGAGDGARRDDPVYADGTGVLDLASGTLRGTGLAGKGRVADAAGATYAVAVRGFEDAETPLGTWTVLGTDGPNDIVATDEKHPVTIRARGGDDQLAGSFTDDVLDGGRGRDTAFGYVGRDRYVGVERIRR